MQLQELKKSIVSKEFNNLYIFTGEEICIMDKYIKALAGNTQLTLTRLDSFGDLYTSITTNSFTKSKNIYLLRDCKEILKNEKIIKNLNTIIGDNIVILVYTKLDKRGKFYKKYQSNIVEFNKLTESQLIPHVKSVINVDARSAKTLINACNNDYGRTMLEADKVLTLARAELYEDQKAFDIAAEQSLFYVEPKDLVFDFVDSVLTTNKYKSFDLLTDLLAIKTSELLLLSLLYINFRNALLVQGSLVPTIESTGLTGWQIQNIKDKCGYYPTKKLINILSAIQSVELGIKTGKLELENCMDKLLIDILGNEYV